MADAFNFRPDPANVSVTDALSLQGRAQLKRARAAGMRDAGDQIGARAEDHEAAALDACASQALEPLMHATAPPSIGAGGEMLVATGAMQRDKAYLIDTVRTRPDMQTARASQERLELANAAGVLPLAADMAETIQAGNSVERAMAHQMAAAHSMAMHFFAQAKEELGAYTATGHHHPNRSVEACRLAGTATRLMDAFGRSALALDRLKTGGQQTVVVKHMQNTVVQDGGQAVIAGKAGGRGARKAKGGGANVGQ